jgi:hypothetical protein
MGRRNVGIKYAITAVRSADIATTQCVPPGERIMVMTSALSHAIDAEPKALVDA